MDFSNNILKFQKLDCQVMGLVRDSPMVVQDWLVEPSMGKGGKNAAAFPCISCPGIDEEDGGMVQAFGIPLLQGSPIPTIIICDKEKKVRYFATFSETTARSVKETLRVVAAIKMVDEANGFALAPADWISP